MARRHYSRFAPEFVTITDRAIAALEKGAAPNGGALLTLDLKEPGPAINVQMQLRQFWTSLALTKPEEFDAFDAGLQRRINYAPMLAVRCKTGSKTVLEVIHRSQLRYSKILAEALGTESEPIIKTPATPARGVSVSAAALEQAIAAVPAGKAQEALIEAAYAKPDAGKT